MRVETETERQRHIAVAQEQGQNMVNMQQEQDMANMQQGQDIANIQQGQDMEQDMGQDLEQERLDSNQQDEDMNDSVENHLLVRAVENPVVEGLDLPTLVPRGEEPIQGSSGGEGGQIGVGLGEGQQGTLELDWVDKSLVQQNRGQASLRGSKGLDPGNIILDTSLERVFGQGATMLAIEFEEETSGKSGESEVNTSVSSTDSDIDVTAVSTPAKDEVSKKRARGGINFGNLSGISGIRASHELSSLSESSEDLEIEVKKLKLAGGGHEEGSDSPDPLEIVTDDEDGGALVSTGELHELVPLEDPGPSGDGDEFSPEGSS